MIGYDIPKHAESHFEPNSGFRSSPQARLCSMCRQLTDVAAEGALAMAWEIQDIISKVR